MLLIFDSYAFAAKIPCAEVFDAVLGSITEGPYRDGNKAIELTFRLWLRDRIDSEEIPAGNLGEKLKDEFVTEQENIFEKNRELMIELLRVKLEKMRNEIALEFIKFGDSRYPIDAFLGSGQEGSVFLVKNRENLVVIKQFNYDSDLEKHILTFNVFKKYGIDAARVIDVNAESSSVMLSYHEGLVLEDAKWLTAKGLSEGNLHHAFIFQHARFQNQVVAKIGTVVSEAVGGLDRWFNVHGNNVIYNPSSNQFTVIDPN